jgi:hypothetical protein
LPAGENACAKQDATGPGTLSHQNTSRRRRSVIAIDSMMAFAVTTLTSGVVSVTGTRPPIRYETA